MTCPMRQVPREGVWWLEISDKILGYWPDYLFLSLPEYASEIQWGGEVLNSNKNGEHTSTQMSNGHFPQEGFGKASFFTDLQIIVEGNGNLKDLENIITFAPKPHCYNVQKFGN